MAAPQGNRNAAKGQAWAEALRQALARFEDKKLKIERGEALGHIAKVVVEKAIGGDKDAAKEIGDRLDGKPAQSLAVSGDEDQPLVTKIIREIVRAKN